MVCPKNVDSVRGELAYLLRFKYENYFQVDSFNRGRHLLFVPPVLSGLPKFYALYKRAFFFSFPQQFPDFVRGFPEFNVVGESINEEFLDTALRFGVDFLLFVYGDGRVYRVSPLLVKRFCELHGLVREQDNFIVVVKDGVRCRVRERTFSFPVKLLEFFGNI